MPADDTDVLLNFCNQYWDEIRHTENQRATLTNLVILIASAIIGFGVQKGLSKPFLVLAILLILLGVYGAAMTLKLYERYNFLQTRLEHFYRQIDALHPNAQFQTLRNDAASEHKGAFPKLSSVRVHQLWLFLHLAISLVGAVLAVIILLAKF
jgi:hypothetical protein